MPYAPFTSTFRAWEQHFTVVQWDQRGAGKTHSRSGKTSRDTLTIDRMAQDGIEVAEYLLHHLNQSKLILVAHSWGTVLGIAMLKRRPDLFSAYVGTGQIVHMAESEALSYDLALEQARRQRNAKALKALQAIGRPPYPDANTWLRKQRVLLSFIPKPAPGRGTPDLNIFSAMLFSPDHTLKDVFALFGSFMSSPARLFQQLMSYDARSLGTAFAMPIFFFQGDTDLQTPAQPVEAYFAALQAPHKELLLLKGEGHIAVLINPDLFLQALLTRVRPLALPQASKDSVGAEQAKALPLPL
jgi:pimeloyl-ACP methyl ester carboxylesterase